MMGDAAKAVSDLEKALELDPEIEEAREYLRKMGVAGY